MIYDDAQPIRGFSQRSLVSHSTFHFLVLCVPDCIALRAGTKIRQRRSLNISRGTPDKGPTASYELKTNLSTGKTKRMIYLHLVEAFHSKDLNPMVFVYQLLFDPKHFEHQIEF